MLKVKFGLRKSSFIKRIAARTTLKQSGRPPCRAENASWLGMTEESEKVCLQQGMQLDYLRFDKITVQLEYCHSEPL